MTLTSTPVCRAGRELGTRTRRRPASWRSGWGFLTPAVVLLIGIVLVPIGVACYLMFTRWSGFGSPKFVGLSNLQRAALEDPTFWHSLGVTAMYVIAAVCICFGWGFCLAWLLYRKPPGWRLFRVAIFIPVVTPGIAMGIFWSFALAPAPLGFLDRMLAGIGLRVVQPNWLSTGFGAMSGIVAVSVWGEVGVATILLFAGMARLPSDVFEAAKIDGASSWQETREVFLPLLRPVMVVVAFVLLVWAIQVFGIPFVLTNGGPQEATYVVGLYIYDLAFRYGEMGYAVAISMLVALVTGVCGIVGGRVLLRRGSRE